MYKQLPNASRNCFTAIAALAILSTAAAQTNKSFTQQPTAIEVLPGSSQVIALRFTPGTMSKRAVSTSEGQAFVIGTDKGTPILKQGAPDLQKLTASIIIPDHANTSVTVVSSSYTDYTDIDIAPSKGNASRTVDPSALPYTKGEAYNADAFFPSTVADLNEPYVMRDYRGQTVNVYPYQYNPVTRTLRVYSEITVKIVVENNNAPGFSRTAPLAKIETEFNNVYARHFINYSNESRYTPVGEQGPMLILTPAAYMSALQPFVDWKTLKGIPVQVVDIATIGANETAIKNYVANYYNSTGLAYLLIVGDAADIPPYTSAYGPSDNTYSFVTGNDHYPEFFVGRFSAQTVAHVNTMVQRTIMYEKYPSLTGTWYTNGLAIASNQGPGDDNEMDWEHERNLRTQLMNYNYSNIPELYDGSHGGADAAGSPSAADITAAVNAGCGIINYTGHGSQTDWVTTGFSNANIGQLTNTAAWPMVISVGCVNGEFINGTCFGEAWTRATDNNGNPTGAIATMMSTINQSWDPPMEGQDEMISILTESYSNNIKRTFGGIALNGCMQMNDAYGAQGDEMTDTWDLFGDPSVMVRTNTPGTMTVSHNNTVILGASSFQVNCNVNDALVSLVLNGQILGTGTVSGGMVNISFPAISTVDTMFVTVTAYNYAPYLGYALVIPPSGPYVMQSAHAIADPTGNMDNMADYSESVTMDVTLDNIGIAPATGVTAVLATTDPNITITDNTESYGNINTQSSAAQAGAYAFTVSSNVADQHSAMFTLTITDANSNTWTSQLSVTLQAPALATANTIQISDPAPGGNGNGILDPGETATIIIPTSNTGHSNSPAATGSLSSTSPYITITNPTFNLGVINEAASNNAMFGVTVSSSIPQATSLDLNYSVAAGAYAAQRTYYHTASVVMETFESNDFSSYAWTQSGNAPWTTTTDTPYEGAYCSLSGIIGNSQSSVMSITMYVTTPDSIRFFTRVSSEQNWDFLRFYVDNVKMDEWTGVSGWARQAYPIGTGYHTFKWSYEKDNVVAANLDCGWVDAITFPPGSLALAVTEVAGAGESLETYPNPFTDVLTFMYSLEQAAGARLSIFNSVGQEVLVLADGQQSAGTHRITLNGNDLAAGIYYCRLQVGEHVTMQKIILAK